MTARVPAPRRRPSREDLRAYKALQGSVLDRALADAKAWRNGYAILCSFVGVVSGFTGTRLTEATPPDWRIALTLLLGVGLVLTAIALWLVMTIEGGERASTLNLSEIVQEHNSFELYRAHQAALALRRLDRSKILAVTGATLGAFALLATMWIPAQTVAPEPSPLPSISPSVVTQAPPTP